ncbi:MAG: WD40 repeat protein [Verrucomicrobiales bacterium]|jgi:WD40 repeat protein
MKTPEQLLTEFEPQSTGLITPDVHVSAIRHSPCGKILAAPAFDQTIRRWDLTTEITKETGPAELKPVNGHNGFVTAIGFHPSRLIAFSADSWGGLQAWPYLGDEPQPIWTATEAHDGWIRDLAVSPDGDWLATCGRDKMVRVWSTTEGRAGEFEGHKEDVFAIGAHPSGKWAVSGDLAGRVIQWEVTTGKIVREFDCSDFYELHRLQDLAGIRKIFFDPEGKTMLIAGSIPTGGANFRGRAHVRMIDFESGETRHSVDLGEEAKDVFAHDVHLHEDGFLIACTTGQPGAGKLIFHVPGEEEPLFTLSKGTINCHSLSVSPDGQQLLVSATNSGSNGNGQRLDKEGNYMSNHSPIHTFSFGKPAEAEKAA